MSSKSNNIRFSYSLPKPKKVTFKAIFLNSSPLIFSFDIKSSTRIKNLKAEIIGHDFFPCSSKRLSIDKINNTYVDDEDLISEFIIDGCANIIELKPRSI